MSERTLKINLEIAQMQTAIKDLVASVDRLNKSIDQMGQRTTKNMTQAATGTRRVKKATVEYNAELRKTESQIERLRNKKNRMTNEERGQLSSLIEKRKRLRYEAEKSYKATVSGANKAKVAQAGLNKQVSLGRQLFLRLRSVMLTVFGAYAIIQGVRNTVNAIKDFELGMARVAAITGATKDELKKLANAARALSFESIFNPTEITAVEVQLGKFGFTVNEISNALSGIVKLATATGEELGSAALLISSSLRALGLDASETTRLVDVLGKSFTTSALDVSKFRESAKYILPLARQMNWTLEEVTATLAKLADAGIHGSLAGTGMRQVYIQLIDASSDLSNMLGKGIRTFDEFYDALEDVKEEGIAFDTVLQTIPRRAQTLFTVLWNGIDAIREYKKAQDDANGAIDEMANIQLETLAYQIDRTNASWKALVVSVQEGGGYMQDTFEGLADTLKGIAMAINPAAIGMIAAADAVEKFKSKLRVTGDEFNVDRITYRIDLMGEAIADAEKELKDLNDQYDFLKLQYTKFTPIGAVVWLKMSAEIGEAATKVEKLKEEQRLLMEYKGDADVFNFLESYKEKVTEVYDALEKQDQQKAFDAFKTEYKRGLDEISDLATTAYATGNEVQLDFLVESYEAYKKWGEKELALRSGQLAIYVDLLREAHEQSIKNRRKLYTLQKQLELEENENRIQSELERELEILRINTKYARLNYELDLESGELTTKQAKIINSLLLELEETYQRERQEVIKKFDDEYLKGLRNKFDKLVQLEKLRHDTEIQLLKNAGATKEEIRRKQIEFDIKQQEKLITFLERSGAAAIELQIAREELAKLNAMLADPSTADDVERNINKEISAYKRLASEVIRSLETIVDAQVDTTERIVSDLNTRIAEVQRELEIENDLYMEGYANNVTLKKKEYEELQQMRLAALKDREAALKKQRALEVASQAINLMSAVASLIKIYAPIPWAGFALAATAVAAFLGLFSASKNTASSMTAYGAGGEIDGKSHSQGGTVIEAERGEYVIQKSMYAKHPELVRAINEDNLPVINQNVLNSASFEKGGSSVIDMAIVDKIYDLLESDSNKQTVSVHNGKRIVTTGIKTRITNV